MGTQPVGVSHWWREERVVCRLVEGYECDEESRECGGDDGWNAGRSKEVEGSLL